MALNYFFILFSILIFFQFLFIITKIKFPIIFYDIPNSRSSHSTNILKIGGLIIFLNFYFLSFFFIENSSIKHILFLSISIFLVSLFDDFFDIPIYLRLLIHFVISGILIYLLNFDHLLISFFFLISLVWITNLYNFMDGINGLSAFMLIFGLTPMAYVAYIYGNFDLSNHLFLLVFLFFPFLYFNFLKNKIFLGDAGSVTTGFIVGAVGLYGWRNGFWPIWFPTILFSIFGADATLTVILRIIYKKNPFVAHRTYFFHKLIDLGFTKNIISLYYAFSMMLSSILCLILLRCSMGTIYISISIYLLFLLSILVFIHLKWLKLDLK